MTRHAVETVNAVVTMAVLAEAKGEEAKRDGIRHSPFATNKRAIGTTAFIAFTARNEKPAAGRGEGRAKCLRSRLGNT